MVDATGVEFAYRGADGAPERPAYTIGPDVTIGIDSHGNTDVGATVGVGRGPVTVIVGL